MGLVARDFISTGYILNNVKKLINKIKRLTTYCRKMAKTLEISDETYEKIKDQLLAGEEKEINNYEDLVGQKFLFRTVTYFLTGEVKKVVGRFVYLKNAAVIFDTGRFMDCIKDGKINEVEPVGEAFVNLDSVTDFFPWKHKLPSDQK